VEGDKRAARVRMIECCQSLRGVARMIYPSLLARLKGSLPTSLPPSLPPSLSLSLASFRFPRTRGSALLGTATSSRKDRREGKWWGGGRGSALLANAADLSSSSSSSSSSPRRLLARHSPTPPPASSEEYRAIAHQPPCPTLSCRPTRPIIPPPNRPPGVVSLATWRSRAGGRASTRKPAAEVVIV
jgi:hypothetical protein